MQLSEIRINLCGPQAGRLKAFCSLTFDNTFVIRDVKIIEGNDGLFLAMPSRKLCDRCRRCGEKNHLRARFCNNCGQRLDENRSMKMHGMNGHGNAGSRLKLHADIAHPINAECRLEIERRAGNLDDVRKSAESIRSSSDKILERVRIDREALEKQVAVLREKAADLKCLAQN